MTAAGEVVRASATENPDLFWALRGGGGNFGVVTRFEFRLHPVGPEVLSGLIVYPIAEAQVACCSSTANSSRKAPEELSVWTVLRKAPPLPFLPESVHGKEMLALALLLRGRPERGRAADRAAAQVRHPLGEHVGVQPYVAWQQAFDPLLTPGARNYWKSHNFTTLDDGLFDAVIALRREAAVARSARSSSARIGGATDAAGARRGRVRPPRRPVRHERPRPLGGRGRRRSAASAGRATSSRRRRRSPAAAST